MKTEDRESATTPNFTGRRFTSTGRPGLFCLSFCLLRCLIDLKQTCGQNKKCAKRPEWNLGAPRREARDVDGRTPRSCNFWRSERVPGARWSPALAARRQLEDQSDQKSLKERDLINKERDTKKRTNQNKLAAQRLTCRTGKPTICLPSTPNIFPFAIAFLIPEVAPKWCCGSTSPADPEIGVSAPGGSGANLGAPTAAEASKSGRVKRMVRLAAELLLLLGLLLLTLHITVLRSSPLPQGNGNASLEQDAALREVSLMAVVVVVVGGRDRH